MNIRTLILPDIHNKWQKVEKIIKYEAPDKIVFLGDYFDDFGDDYRVATETAQWLVASIEQKNRIHIMGNHDMNYAFKDESYKCSGYESAKDYAINSIIEEKDWRKLYLYTWVGDWLCTHAGVHKHFYVKYGNKEDFKIWLKNICDEALVNAFNGEPAHPILAAGVSRGGRQLCGGINWCDAYEFKPIESINQIFGHTPHRQPRYIDEGSPLSKKYSSNLCLDVGNCNYYVLHDNQTNKLDVKKYTDL